MPTIPGYDAQRNIKAIPGAVTRNEAAVPYENFQKAVGAITGVTQEWSNAHDVMQATEARTKYNTGLLDLRKRAEEEADFKNSPKYFEELSKLKEASLEGIDNQAVRNTLDANFEYETQLAGFELGNIFQKKEIDYTRLKVVPDLLNGYQEKMITAGTKAAYTAEKIALRKQIDALVASNVYSLEEGEKLMAGTLYGAAESAVYADPHYGISLINKGRFDLTSEDKIKLKEVGKRIIKRENDLEKFKMTQNNITGALSLSEALMNGTLTPDMPRKLQAAGLIDTKTASLFYAHATGLQYEADAKSPQADFLLYLLEDNKDKPEQIRKILTESSKLFTKGELGINQYQYFIHQAQLIADKFAKQDSGEDTLAQKVKRATISIMEFFGYEGDEEKRSAEEWKAVTEFVGEVGKGKDPDEAVLEVLKKQFSNRVPGWDQYPDGTLMEDAIGAPGELRIKESKSPIGFQYDKLIRP